MTRRPVRARFAPSPTGHLHVGGARTALYNWAFARGNDGAFVLRIDDTDRERSTPENTAAILRALRWLGLDWDEGPEAGGEHGPYLQTERAALYREALESLEADGRVYACFCPIDELKAKREARQKAGGYQGYDRSCRGQDPDEARARVAAGEPHVWRLKVPADRGDVVVQDAVRGSVAFAAETLDDLIIVRSDGTPTYNFATVVDDHHMGITHVIRGDDHLSNTPRQVLLFEAMRAEPPDFAHLSMIRAPDGSRLSKRHGATSVEAFREEGYLPEALVNYLALLGWSLDDSTTLLSREDLARHFSLERISANPAVFDAEKLEWLNGVYLREMDPDELSRRMAETLARASLASEDDLAARPGWYRDLAVLVAERVRRLMDIPDLVRFLFVDEVDIDEDARRKVLEKDGAAAALEAALAVLGGLDEFDAPAVEQALRALPEELDLKPRVVFQAVRVAVTGVAVSLPLFESLALLGKERATSRLRAAIDALGG